MVFDLETETNKKFKRVANPFTGENWVVMRGWKVQGDRQCSWSHHPTPDGSYLRIPDDVDILIGHNIKFDLLYEMQAGNPDLKAFFKRGGWVWCTQYAEYLLNAQHPDYHMNALDEIVESYGGRKKIDAVKELWAAGVKTSEINPDILTDYLVGTEEEDRNSGDIGNTELVFLGQIKEARANGMIPCIKARMDALCATTEMEFNGLKIDTKEARRRLAELKQEEAELSERLNEYVQGMPDGLKFNWNSRVHVSCLLYGGTIKYSKQAPYIDPKTGEQARKQETQDWPLFDGEPVDPNGEWKIRLHDDGAYYSALGEPQDRYASGKKKGEPKFKKVKVPGEIKVKYQDFFHELPGFTEPKPEWQGQQTDGAGNPIYGTGADIIEALGKRNVPFLKDYSKYVALTKEIGTYYVKWDEKKGKYTGMLACVDPRDHIIHHSLNHTNTVTSRLSGSDPNLQNIPRGDKSQVKRMFVSRFGDDGVVLELDYSQLEVVIQGMLSKDFNLCRDLNDRVDFHCKRVALKNGIAYTDALYWCKDESYEDYAKWKKERTKCKIFSFQRAYGAGAPTIAEETGMPVEEVEDMIAKEDKEYPGVVKFNQEVERAVNASAEFFKDPQRGWRTFRRGQWQAPTGTLYEWRTYDAPSYMRKRGITDTFNPPELKNYPVQGTGGEVVCIKLGELWRHFVANDNYGGRALLVNTVHDCVWADAMKEIAKEVAADIKRIMESVPESMKRLFGMEVNVPYPVEAEWGPNMLDLHHLDI